ncbi:methyltransferase domain-containing protein [Mucilaginibacter ginkgonis]|uniref:Methyltransferase domain-containing protein n=1 Tax=Mucilaginibacter ginkgonis TaxID=2682091 RepID=A0A6I4I3T3_9SPHI|nr:methyltransferase domain-containing protein [Mucilaginibacter ginkgonis]QQL49109.1 methyltransferase domain-containing protein [Mucilaginibacter ginkgonis]
MKWNAELYDDKHAFVYQFGESVLGLLDVKPGERIHDLGCGTGDLTKQIQELGADVIGTDLSPQMIAKAKEKFPDVKFEVADAADFELGNDFDAVFSNAALHWVKDQDAMMTSVYKSLKPGGRFVAEMGGKGNVQKLITVTRDTLNKYGYHQQAKYSQWYFPSVGEYASRLESHGFRVTFAVHFDRKTPLQDGEAGLIKWIEMFGSPYFEGVTPTDKEKILNEITALLKPDYEENGQWYADYKRLRFTAIKEM